MYCRRMGSLFRVLINRHSVRAVIPAIGLSFALNEWSDKQWSDKQWLGTNRAHMMSNRGSDSLGLSLDTSSSTPQTIQPFSEEWFKPFVSITPVYDKSEHPTNPTKPLDYRLGSGFIYDKRGLVLTGDNTCMSYEKFMIRLGDGTQVLGTVLSRRQDYNLAVIQLEGNRDDWPIVNRGFRSIQLYDQILVVINPRSGLYNQVTDGVVTFPQRKGKDIGVLANNPDLKEMTTRNYIQHTASISSSDGGTAVVTPDGIVIGINIIFHKPRLQYAINITMALLLVKKGTASEKAPILGLIVSEMTDERRQWATNRGLTAPTNCFFAQIFNTQIPWGGVAEQTVITHVNGVEVSRMDDLYRAVDELRNGGQIVITFIGDQKCTIERKQIHIVAQLGALVCV